MALRSAFVALLALSVSVFAAPAKRATCADDSKGRSANNAQCCKWFDVLDDMQENLFKNTCGQNVHQSLRIAFHDAIGRSVSKGPSGGGGADGSILEPSFNELKLSENLSVNGIAALLSPFASKHNATFGDIIQFAAAAGITNCPGAPKVEFLANRPAPTVAAPEFSVPRGNDNADTMVARLTDGGFTTAEFVALMMSHSVAAQSGIDANVKGAPFDTTPAKFDTQFYIETSLKGTNLTGPAPTRAEDLSPITGEFRLQSDGFLARDSRLVCDWQSLITQPQTAVSRFGAAMAKMATNGQDRDALIDCSDVIPDAMSLDFSPHFPDGKTKSDVDAVCPTAAFPDLPTTPDPTSVDPVPPQD